MSADTTGGSGVLEVEDAGLHETSKALQPAPSTRPFLVMYVAWHPAFADGERLARVLFEHYRRNPYENVAGGIGLPVVYRSALATGSTTPIDIDLDDAETSAIVLPVDGNWANDPDWVNWEKALTDRQTQCPERQSLSVTANRLLARKP